MLPPTTFVPSLKFLVRDMLEMAGMLQNWFSVLTFDQAQLSTGPPISKRALPSLCPDELIS